MGRAPKKRYYGDWNLVGGSSSWWQGAGRGIPVVVQQFVARLNFLNFAFENGGLSAPVCTRISSGMSRSESELRQKAALPSLRRLVCTGLHKNLKRHEPIRVRT